MDKQNLILLDTICVHYAIEPSFFDDLQSIGLIELQVLDDHHYIRNEEVSDIEKMIRLHHELNVNLEGIDIIFNLLRREMKLKEEIHALREHLRFYENF